MALALGLALAFALALALGFGMPQLRREFLRKGNRLTAQGPNNASSCPANLLKNARKMPKNEQLLVPILGPKNGPIFGPHSLLKVNRKRTGGDHFWDQKWDPKLGPKIDQKIGKKARKAPKKGSQGKPCQGQPRAEKVSGKALFLGALFHLSMRQRHLGLNF